jgi:hypothetical protein
MTAQDQHLERVVVVIGWLAPGGRPFLLDLELAARASGIGSLSVDETARRDPYQPASGVRRQAFAGPLHSSSQKGFLGGVFTVFESYTPTLEGSEDVWRLATPHVPDSTFHRSNR